MRHRFSFFTFILFPILSFSQSGLESILLAVESDSKKIFERYLDPMMKGAIYSSNGGWFTTAKVHKKLGVDLSLRLNTSFVPNADRTYSISDLEYITTSADDLPTIAGDNRQEDLIVTIPADGIYPEISSVIKSPKGIRSKLPLGSIPAPVLQLGVGIPFDTEIIIRYSPEYHRNGVDMSLKGIGLKHNLLQYFGAIEKIPLNVSAFASISNMNIDYDIQSFSSLKGTGQVAQFNLNNYNLLLLASLDLMVVDFYTAFGYSGGSSSFKLLGNYDLEYNSNSDLPITKSLSDPIDMSFNVSGYKTTIGARFKFLVFSAFTDFTFQRYNTLSAGISVNFR